MKKITFTLAGFILAFAVHAQDAKTETSSQAAGVEIKKAHAKEFYTMKGGKLMMMKEGKMVTLDKEIKMTDGSKITPDGTVTAKDGSKLKLADGDRMYSDGTIETGGKRNPTPPPPPPPTKGGGDERNTPSPPPPPHKL